MMTASGATSLNFCPSASIARRHCRKRSRLVSIATSAANPGARSRNRVSKSYVFPRYQCFLFSRSAFARRSHCSGGVESSGPCDDPIPRTISAIATSLLEGHFRLAVLLGLDPGAEQLLEKVFPHQALDHAIVDDFTEIVSLHLLLDIRVRLVIDDVLHRGGKHVRHALVSVRHTVMI